MNKAKGTWYQVTNQAASNPEILLYDEIGLWGVSAGDFVKDLQAIKAKNIDLRMSTPGGEVFDGLAIFAALRRHPARITVHIDGLAASIASVIAMAGDEILIDRYAQVMIHEAHAIAVGNTDDMTAMARLLDECSGNIASIYADRAGGDAQAWRARMKTETWYSAAEAKAAGLVDEIAATRDRTRSRAESPANTWDLSIFRYPGRDKAPPPLAAAAVLNTAPAETKPPQPEPAPASEPVPSQALPAKAGFADDAFDPDAFRQAVTAAAQVPFDPSHFRELMQSVAASAPALPTTTRPAPVDLGPPLPAPPEPAPEATPWDGVRDLMQSVAGNAPALPGLAPRPVDLGPPLPTPAAPPPEPGPNPWDTIRSAMTLAATTAPAPPDTPDITTEPDPAGEPGLLMDAQAFRTALRRATL